MDTARYICIKNFLVGFMFCSAHFNTQCYIHISQASHLLISSLFNVRVSAPHCIPRKCFYNVLHCQIETPRPKFSFLVKSFLHHFYCSFCLFYRPTSSVLWLWEPAGMARGHLSPLKYCKVFCASLLTVKRPVDQLFMHYFHNFLSVSGGFAPRPLICPPLEKILWTSILAIWY